MAHWNTASETTGAQLTFGVSVTQRRLPHVTEAQGAFAATIDKQVAVVGVELGRCDHLRQVLHVGRLDVHDVWEGGSRSGKQQKSQRFTCWDSEILCCTYESS